RREWGWSLQHFLIYIPATVDDAYDDHALRFHNIERHIAIDQKGHVSKYQTRFGRDPAWEIWLVPRNAAQSAPAFCRPRQDYVRRDMNERRESRSGRAAKQRPSRQRLSLLLLTSQFEELFQIPRHDASGLNVSHTFVDRIFQRTKFPGLR